MWRLGPALKLALAQMLVQMGSCRGVRRVAAALLGMPSSRVNSAAPSALSPPAAGKTTCLVTSNAA